jgi:SAM-dependent methyltransferase
MKSNKNSVKSVAIERWRMAQEWELETWRREQTRLNSRAGGRKLLLSALLRRRRAVVGDDWNEWWSRQFDGYQAVSMVLNNVIEVGCGPYTNVRLIGAGRTIEHLYCSDPLARHYAGFSNGWLSQAYRNREILLDDHPAETLPFADNLFDLTVIINVLDHVYDSAACLTESTRITRSGGMLILGQDLTDESDPGAYDVGHPIRLDHEMLDDVLERSFCARLRKVLSREEGRNPEAHYGTYVYIGEKE